MGRFVTDTWPPGEGGHPYAAYVPHPLGGWTPDLSRSTADRIAAAEADLEDMAAECARVPSRWAAESLMSQGESLSSSAIEGIGADLAGLSFQAIDDQQAAAGKAALGNLEMIAAAMDMAEEGRGLSEEDLLELHDTLMCRTPTPQLGGRFRLSAGWVGGQQIAGTGPLGARYVPPPTHEVKPLVADLIDYINHSDHSPVLKAAVAHAQFETIHPFADGNGRVGRALILFVLADSDITGNTPIPVSRAILANRDAYYNALDRFHSHQGPPGSPERSAGLEPWAVLLSDTCQQAAEQVRATSRAVHDLLQDWAGRLMGRRSDDTTWKIIEELPYTPVFTVNSLSERLEGSASATAIRRAVRHLAEVGIVEPVWPGKRNRIFKTPEFMEIAEHILDTRNLQPGAPIAPLPRPASPVGDTISLSAGDELLAQRLPAPRAASRRDAFWRCGHIGERSQKQCAKREGHRGQHSY